MESDEHAAGLERRPARGVRGRRARLSARPSAAERTFWAPGRINLIGEHTDYCGGLVLPAAIDLGITIVGRPAERIRLRSDAADEPVDLAGDGSDADPASWARYVAAVAQELDALGRPPVGFDGRVTSTLPLGAGLASSAALEVAIAVVLCAVAELELPPLELAAACRRAEERAVGVPCGIMDQAASVLGEEGCAILLDCGTLEHDAVRLPAGLALVAVDSGVRHAHEHSGYADRRRELEEALSGAASELHRRRLRHVESENERVRETVAALEAPERLGPIFRASHESLRDDYEVSTPELDLIVDLAYESGAVAARLTGGGFGGSIVALVDAQRAPSFREAITAGYRERTGRDATVHVCAAADGAGEL